MKMTDIEVLSTCDDTDPEICEIFKYEEQTEFISRPPRGLIGPIPIRPVPPFPWDCEDDCSQENKTSPASYPVVESLTHNQSTSKPEVTVSEEVNGVVKGTANVQLGADRHSSRGGGEDVAQLSSDKPTAKLIHRHTVAKKIKKSRSLLDLFRRLFRRFRR